MNWELLVLIIIAIGIGDSYSQLKKINEKVGSLEQTADRVYPYRKEF